jgi:uncharacterized protein
MAYKVVIAGGTGFLGTSLIQFLQQKTGVEITVLTRHMQPAAGDVSYVQWDAKTPGRWMQAIDECDAVINLVGKSVNCRYTSKNKHEIIRSRVDATLAIGKAIEQSAYPPKVWINAGSAAIFGNDSDSVNDEYSSLGTGFSAEVCKQWEQAFFSTNTPSTRKIVLRMGLVFQKDIGLLQPFIKLAKAGLGGTIGSGNQYLSWIHENDFLNIIYHSLVDESYEGIIHCTSPCPVTNEHFMRALRKALNCTFAIPNPSVFVKLGALIIGTEPVLVLTGRSVISRILKEKAFNFQYPVIEDALQHLINKAQVHNFVKV